VLKVSDFVQKLEAFQCISASFESLTQTA